MAAGQEQRATEGAAEVETAWPLADRYRIERQLAVGGMSTLYVARTIATGELVALKVIDARLAQDAAGVQRFLREVRLASSIRHPGLVEVRDAGVARGPDGASVPYLAMELLDGQNLADVLAAGDRTQREALGWIRELLAALAAVHAHGVVHRDLKFENAFAARRPGGRITVKLLDFGIARERLDARAPTTTGTTLGTVYYMAPEQSLDARSVTAAADVYALGVMLYQLLAGTYPFDGDSPHAVLVRAHTTDHQPLGARVPDLDPRLAALVDRCLDREPAARPADATELSAALAPLLDDPAIDAWLARRRVDPTTFRDDPAAAPPPQALDLAAALSASLPPTAPSTAPAPTPRRARWAIALAVALLALGLAATRWRRPRCPDAVPRRPVAVPRRPGAVLRCSGAVPRCPGAVGRGPACARRPAARRARGRRAGAVAPSATAPGRSARRARRGRPATRRAAARRGRPASRRAAAAADRGRAERTAGRAAASYRGRASRTAGRAATSAAAGARGAVHVLTPRGPSIHLTPQMPSEGPRPMPCPHRLAAALAATAAALVTTPASASPWTLPRGTIVFQGTFQYQTATREFFERGPSRSFPLNGHYVGNTFTLGLRAGITERLELEVALPIRTVAYTSDPVILAQRDPASTQPAADFYRRNIINLSRTATGIGDLYLSARYRLALRPFAVAVGLRLKAPTGYVGPSGTFGDRPQSAAEFARSPERYADPENVRDDVTLGDGQLDLQPELLLGYAFPTRTFLRIDAGFNGRFGGAGQQVVGAVRAGQSVGASLLFYAWAQACVSVTGGRVIGVSVAAQDPDLPAVEYDGTRNLLLRELRLERDLVEFGVGAIVRVNRDVELNLGYTRGLWGRNVALTDTLFASIGVRTQVPGLQ